MACWDCLGDAWILGAMLFMSDDSSLDSKRLSSFGFDHRAFWENRSSTDPRWSSGYDFRLSWFIHTSAGEQGSIPCRGDLFADLIFNPSRIGCLAFTFLFNLCFFFFYKKKKIYYVGVLHLRVIIFHLGRVSNCCLSFTVSVIFDAISGLTKSIYI